MAIGIGIETPDLSDEEKAQLNGAELPRGGFATSVPIVPETSDSFIGRRGQDIGRGIQQLKEMGGGLETLAGTAVGSEDLQNAGIDTMQSAQRGEQILAPRVGTIGNVKNPGDLLEYLTEGILQNSPQILMSLIPGAVGGGLAAKGVGAGINAITRQEAEGIAKSWVEKYGADKAQEMVAKRIELGQAAGVYGSSVAQETGTIASQNVEDTGNPNDAANAAVFGPIAGMLEGIPEIGILQKTLGTSAAEQAMKSKAARLLLEPLKTAGTGAATEGAQNFVENAANQQVDPKAGLGTPASYFDSMILGGVSEGAAHIVTAAPGLMASGDPKVRAIEHQVLSGADAKTDPATDAILNAPLSDHELRDAEIISLENQIKDPTLDEATRSEAIKRHTELTAPPAALPVTQEASDLISQIDSGGAAPAFISSNLHRIATENGIEVTPQTSPDDIIKGLRDKANTATPSVEPPPAEPVDSSEAIQKFETDKGRLATEDEKSLLGQSVLVNDNLQTINAKLDEALQNDQEAPNLQEARKQAIEKLNGIKSQLDGYDPHSNEATYTPQATGSNNWLTEKGRQAKAEKWIGGPLTRALRGLIAPEVGNEPFHRQVKQAYKTALTPYAQLFAGNDVAVKPMGQQFEDAKLANKGGSGFQVTWGDDGALTLHLAEPDALVSKFGEDLQGEIANVLPKKLEEEADHVAFFAALRNEWRKTTDGKAKKGYEKFINNRLLSYYQDIQGGSSDKTLKAIVQTYIKTDNVKWNEEKNRWEAKKQGKTYILTKQEVAQEFIRGVIQRMRTGQTTEDVQLLATQAKAGNTGAGKILNAILDAIRTIREAIINFINPATAPARITDILNRTNAILDQFTPRDLESYKSNSGVATHPESTGGEQSNGLPPASETAAPKEAPGVQLAGEENTPAGEPPASSEAQKAPELSGQPSDQSTVNVEPPAGQEEPPVNQDWKKLSFIRTPPNAAQNPEDIIGNPEGERPFAGAPADFTPTQAKADAQASAAINQTISKLSEAQFPEDTTGKPRKSSIGYAIGVNNPGLMQKTRGWLTSYDNINHFIDRNGFFGALQKAASGALGSMSLDDRIGLSLTLEHFAPDYKNSLKASRVPFKDYLSMVKDLTEMRQALQDRLVQLAQTSGRGLAAFGAFQKAYSGGESTVKQYWKNSFSAALAVEKALNTGNLAGIVESFEENLYPGIDQAFTNKQFLAKLGRLVKAAIAMGPKELKAQIKNSIVKNRNAVKNAISNPVARAAEDAIGPDTEIHLMNLASKIGADIQNQSPSGTGMKAQEVMLNSLNRFARDILNGKIPKKETQIKDRGMRILHSVIVNDSHRKDFVKILRSEIASHYIGGLDSPAFQADYNGIFEQMQNAKWSDQIRNRAIDEVMKNIGMNVRVMVEQHWGQGKEAVFKAFRERIGAVVPDDTLHTLINEIDKELDRRVEDHLENTFGFKRDENGKLLEGESGGLQGGAKVREILSNAATSLRDLTKITYASKEAYLNGLAQAYTEEMGLPSAMAEKIQGIFAQSLSDAVDWQKNKGLVQKLQAISDQLSDQKKAPATKSMIDRLVEMSHQGYLDNPTVYEAIRKSYDKANLPKFDPALAQQIRDMGDVMDSLPESDMKNEMRTEIANAIAGNPNATEKVLSYYYTSLLSGPTTFLMVNPIGNFANLMLNSAAWAAENPKRIGKIMAAWGNVLTNNNTSAWRDFAYTMQTGYAPIGTTAKLNEGLESNKTHIENAQLPLERIQKQEGIGRFSWGNLFYSFARGISLGKVELSPRMLSRFLSATDAFFRSAGAEVSLAAQGQEITPEIRDQATQQAEEEFAASGQERGLNDIRFNRRADEIAKDILASQSPESNYAVNVANQRALETAFTQTPQGVVGMVAKAIGNLTYKITPLRAIFPFTNIVANVWNESLNYTPLGLSRYFLAKTPAGLDWGIQDKDGNTIGDKSLLVKSIMGAFLIGVINSLQGDDDGQDRLVIYGNGPSNPDDRKAWYDRGGRPYSMNVFGTWIGYQYLGPVGQMLGLLGTEADLRRETKSKSINPSQYTFAAIAGLLNNQMSQSFVSSFSGLMQALTSDDPGGSMKRWAAFQTSSVIPNAIKQTGRWVDPQIGQSSDFAAMVLKDIPVVKWMAGNEPALNYRGDPVYRREIPIIGKLVGVQGGDPTLSALYGDGLRVPGYDFTINGTTMDDQQRYNYVKIAGPQIGQALDAALPALHALAASGHVEQAQNMIQDITSQIKRSARKKMMSNDYLSATP